MQRRSDDGEERDPKHGNLVANQGIPPDPRDPRQYWISGRCLRSVSVKATVVILEPLAVEVLGWRAKGFYVQRLPEETEEQLLERGLEQARSRGTASLRGMVAVTSCAGTYTLQS